MILVTGTKRSGTSMWMQILEAAGFEILGARFPGTWGDSIRECNPRGFYETRFRQGVFFATNPDPRTGRFLRPEPVERHVVKVFIPGLLPTDWAYVGKVLATMRHWREYASSLERLYGMEQAWREAHGSASSGEPNEPNDGLGERDSPSERRVRAGRLPPALEWWFENFELVRDVATRGYAFHMTTYDRLLRDPAAEIGPVLEWLGGGAVGPAVAAVEGSLRTYERPAYHDPCIDEPTAALFDRFYDAVNDGEGLSAEFVQELNEAHRALVSQWDEERKALLEQRELGPQPGAPSG